MKRTGGIAKAGHRAKPFGDGTVYFIPEVADRMFETLREHLDFYKSTTPRVLDACAGSGVLGHSLSRFLGGAEVIFQDKSHSGKSILDEIKPPESFDIIVCNPPWKETLATAIYFHLLSLLKLGGQLIFIINNVWMYQGPTRANRILCDKFYFLPRYVFKWSGRPMLDCGVLVYRKDPTRSASTYIDIPKDVHTLNFLD